MLALVCVDSQACDVRAGLAVGWRRRGHAADIDGKLLLLHTVVLD